MECRNVEAAFDMELDNEEDEAGDMEADDEEDDDEAEDECSDDSDVLDKDSEEAGTAEVVVCMASDGYEAM